MSMIWRRYAKSTRYARSRFYIVLAIGFAALAGWAVVERDWLVGVIAAVMVVLAAITGLFARRLSRELAASESKQRLGQV
jgi:uncharacterized membrane protein